MNTVEQALAYARAHPTRAGGVSWSGWCESFVFRAGGFTRFYPTALAAGNASGPLNPDWTRAPRGAIHYWSGVYVRGIESGHTALDIGGGTLLMASSRVSNMGRGLGTIHYLDYGLPNYRGWTMRHGTEVIEGTSSTAANSVEVIEMKAKDLDHMKILSVPNGTIALVGDYDTRVYTTTEGGSGFSIGSNSKAFGNVTGLSPDELTTVVNEAAARRAALVADVAAAVLAALPAPVPAAVVELDSALGALTLDPATITAIAAAVGADLVDRLAE
jgi:hypothetical protein